MRVFVAGATGAIGRRLMPRLVAAGHQVTGMTRSQARATDLQAVGATPAVCDVFDAPAVLAAVEAAAPEVIVSQLTDLPAVPRPRGLSKVYEANNRVRTEGNANLLAAARNAAVPRIVAQSVAFWYRPEGGPVKSEDAPLDTEAGEPIGSAVRAMKQVEDALSSAPDVDAVLLRYGFFYGPGTWYAPDGAVGRQLRRRSYPIVGSGRGMYSLIHIDDAAAATVAALTAPPGTYNITDDDPAPANDWLPAFAAAIGAPKPMRVPAAVARLLVGPALVGWMETLRGADNSAAKRHLGWQPAYATWRQGFRLTFASD